MIQYGSYSVEVVHAAVAQAAGNKRAVLPDGVTFNALSQRLELFSTKGVRCVSCGIEGSIYVLESQSNKVPPHLNLYAVGANGKHVLMTKDHIHPRSKGGANKLWNYATMCRPCNGAKADKITREPKVAATITA